MSLAFCDMGEFCRSGMDMGLIDSRRCQRDQVLTDTISKKGSKRLVVGHKLHQAHTLAAELYVVNVRTVHSQHIRLARLDWVPAGSASRSLRSHTRNRLSGRSAVARLRCQQQGSEGSWQV